MKVKIDPQRCQGHNRCCLIAEEMFEVDDYGLAHALNDGAHRSDSSKNSGTRQSTIFTSVFVN